MPESPSKYRQRYLPVVLEGCTRQERIHVRKYRSSFSGNKFRKEAYEDLRDFILKKNRYKGGANGAGHSYHGDGRIFSFDLGVRPVAEVNIGILDKMFTGVGRPRDFANLLRVVDLYLRNAEMDAEQRGLLGWTKVPLSLQDYADAYLGVDCRGFAGAYYAENFPRVKDTAKDFAFYIDGYNKSPANFHTKKSGSNFRRIDDPRDVRAGDLLVKCDSGDGNRHVAVVDSVSGATSMRVIVGTAESRHSKGELCTMHGGLSRIEKRHKSGRNDRNWKHCGTLYNFVLQPK